MNQLSEATLTWEHWRSRRRLKRHLKAWGSSLLFAAAVAGLLLWGGFPRIFNVGEKGEALTVKLGNPEGEDLPLAVSALPDPAMQAVMTAQRDTALTTVEETRASVSEPEPSAEPAPAAKPVPKMVPLKPLPPKSAETPEPIPLPTAPPTPTPTPTPPAEVKPADKPVVTEKVIRGSEKGNASELILKPQGEKISQNAYWPVYLFMPLPAKLDLGLLARVPGNDLYNAEERRALLL
ncbi:MAG: hypothetical protein WCJ96_11610, partial [Verrucomicrobiota bacterium]